MTTWTESRIQSLLDHAELALSERIESLQLPAVVLRKERAVGIIPTNPMIKLPRESLEEIVLAVSKVLEISSPNPPTKLTNGDKTAYANGNSDKANKIPFCAFNGGNDVFVDVGDKSLGVRCVQKYFSDQDNGCEHPIYPYRTIHVGDQFLSLSGMNDFRARTVATTAWVASPTETVGLLDEIIAIIGATTNGNGEGVGNPEL
jgi:IMP and pyridine-specific 5'-nucleotidase